MIITIFVSVVLYMAVAMVAVGAIGAAAMSQSGSPLQAAAATYFRGPTKLKEIRMEFLYNGGYIVFLYDECEIHRRGTMGY